MDRLSLDLACPLHLCNDMSWWLLHQHYLSTIATSNGNWCWNLMCEASNCTIRTNSLIVTVMLWYILFLVSLWFSLCSLGWDNYWWTGIWDEEATALTDPRVIKNFQSLKWVTGRLHVAKKWLCRKGTCLLSTIFLSSMPFQFLLQFCHVTKYRYPRRRSWEKCERPTCLY